jgi:hypothetical protein
MTYFYLYIFILFCFIFFVPYYNYNNYENFVVTNDTIVLLGDSIIKNNAYVSNGESIENIIITKTKKNVACYAVDHAKIVDVYNQISKIPLELNTENTNVFLSIGGNDILFYYVDQEGDITNTSILQTIFSSYKKIIESIQIRIPNAKLYLLDIYYPDNLKYQQYHSIIREWNTMLYNYANDPSNKITGVIKISNALTESDDFSFGIEPSAKGGIKIIESILNY